MRNSVYYMQTLANSSGSLECTSAEPNMRGLDEDWGLISPFLKKSEPLKYCLKPFLLYVPINMYIINVSYSQHHLVFFF